MAGAHLQGLAVAHHGLTGHGVDGPGEALRRSLAALVDGNGQDLLHAVGVDLVQDADREVPGLGLGGMAGVALLPEEFSGAQEQPGPQFPAHDVGPLVHQQRQVPVALDPLGEVGPHHRLGGGPDGQGLLQLLATADGDHGQFGAEALHVLGLLLEEGHGHEQGEVGVVDPGGFDAVVHGRLQALPQREAVGPDDHGPPGRSVLGQLGLRDDVLVPAGEVLALGGEHGSLGHRAEGSGVQFGSPGGSVLLRDKGIQ